MADYRLIRSLEGGWHTYDLHTSAGDPLASARWRKHDDYRSAELHNDIRHASKSVIALNLRLFGDIVSDIRAAGCATIIVMSNRYTDTMGKYWRRLGFELFGTYEHGDTAIPYAVMGV